MNWVLTNLYVTTLISIHEQEMDAINVNYSTKEVHANPNPIS
jgi:hypothetical protein